MTSPLLPLTIAIGAALADGGGFHRIAFYLVLLAIPAAAAAALAAAGELADGKHATFRTVCTAVALALLVLSSAARASAPEGAAVPVIAISALLAGVAAYVSLGLAWVVRPQHELAPTGVTRSAIEPARESHAT